ncbi:MAG: hypothetical protein ABI970_05255 [Chloroflexota bacterium]
MTIRKILQIRQIQNSFCRSFGEMPGGGCRGKDYASAAVMVAAKTVTSPMAAVAAAFECQLKAG